jgi:hypothetical protein
VWEAVKCLVTAEGIGDRFAKASVPLRQLRRSCALVESIPDDAQAVFTSIMGRMDEFAIGGQHHYNSTVPYDGDLAELALDVLNLYRKLDVI